jgi:molecular chaperone GrpE
VTKHKSKKKGTDHPPLAAEAPAPEPTLAEAAPAEPAAAPKAEAGEAEPLAAPELSPQEKLEALQQELAQAQAERGEYLDGWQRERAEFLNYKKRVERDLESAHAVAAASILTRYLAVLDDLERALKDPPASPEFTAWVDGIQLIQRKLQAILDAEGVEVIQAEGMLFDPTIHEAVTFEPHDGFHEGQIIEVLQKGYRLGERILRPAMVRVAR